MRFVSVRLDGRPRNEAAVFAVHKRLAAMDQMTRLCPQFAISVPAFSDGSIAKNGDGDVTMRCAKEQSVECLQPAHV